MAKQFEMTDNSEKFIDEKDRKIEAVLEAIGLQLEGEAKDEIQNKPERVDTGLLRNSITHAIGGKAPAVKDYKATYPDEQGKIKKGGYIGTAPADKNKERSVHIGTNVEYAPYVHDGTRDMEPNRFLRNAVQKNEKQIREWIKRELKA